MEDIIENNRTEILNKFLDDGKYMLRTIYPKIKRK